MASDCDVLIVGQGLAGSTLAWRLAARGVSVAVVDRGGVDDLGRPSASRVAAGLITPVTGKRLTVAQDYQTVWESARDFYRSVERETAGNLLDQESSLRLFFDDEEQRLFKQRFAAGRLGGRARLAQDNELPSGIDVQHGGFIMPEAARLNTREFVASTARWLQSQNRLHVIDLEPERDLQLTALGVEIPQLEIAARSVVFCQGYAPRRPSWLHGYKLKPTKGEILTVEAPHLRAIGVVHRGVWIAPAESRRRATFCVGATTSWDLSNSVPTDAARAELLQKLAAAGVTDARVVEHQAAVRPATPDRRPTFGLCPAEPRVGWLNGLGSKGSLWAPWAAERLAESLVDRLEKR